MYVEKFLLNKQYSADRDFLTLQRAGAIGDRPVDFWASEEDGCVANGTVRPLGFGRFDLRYEVVQPNGFVQARIHCEFRTGGRRLSVYARTTLLYEDGSTMQSTVYTGWKGIRDHVVVLHARPLPGGLMETSVSTDMQGPLLCSDVKK